MGVNTVLGESIDSSYVLDISDEYGNNIASCSIKLDNQQFEELCDVLFKWRHEWILNFDPNPIYTYPRGVKTFVDKYKASLDETRSINKDIYFDENEEDIDDLYSNL